MGTSECFVVAGVGNNDVVVGCLWDGIKELLAEIVETDVELGGDGNGGSNGRVVTNGITGIEVELITNVDNGLIFANGDVWIGDTRFGHHQNDAGTLGSCN